MNTPCIRAWTRRKHIDGLGLFYGRSLPTSLPFRSLTRQHHLQQNASVAVGSRRRRGGLNLNERFSHLPNNKPERSLFMAQLSAPGAAHRSSQEAASRLARTSEEYTLVGGVRIPKKPSPPADDGSSPLSLCALVYSCDQHD
jgi:hypothetical protein